MMMSKSEHSVPTYTEVSTIKKEMVCIRVYVFKGGPVVVIDFKGETKISTVSLIPR